MKLKPYYKLSDFSDHKGNGKNWIATCPVCEKKHLSISKATGLFHCFSPGCDFNGQLDEFKPYPYQHNALGVRNCDTDVNLNVLNKDKSKDGSSSKRCLEGTTAKRSGLRACSREATAEQPVGNALGVDSKKGSCLEGSTSYDLESDFLPEDYESLEPSVIRQLKPIEPGSPVAQYLESIHIPLEVAQAAGCMSATRTFSDVQRPCLCYVNRLYGNIINVKYRAVNAKQFTQDAQKAKDAPSAPFNIECLNPLQNDDDNPSTSSGQAPDENCLVITEGEKDCLTVLATGRKKVISIPNGAGNKPETCFAPFMGWLQQVKRVIICGDQDKAGRVMKRNLKAFFEQMQIRVAIATMSSGCKDIADVNISFGLDEVRRVIDSAPFPANSDIIHVGSIRRNVKDYLLGQYDHGYSVGYGEYTDQHFWLTDEGGLIIVTGRPNSGKTDWLRCTLAKLMVTGRGCCFLSFEEPKKEKHIGHILEVMLGTRQTRCYDEAQMDSVIDWLDRLMVDLDMRLSAPTTRNIIRYADDIRRDGFDMRFMVIDPYLFVDMGSSKENETKLIKDMLTTLQTWGRNNNIWVCMVAHPRMLNNGPEGEFEEIDPYKVSGSAHWANLADFLISVKRIFPSGENNDDGSKNPSYTKVSVLKVRDQDLCHTGNIYYMRHASGRYFERPSEEACKQEIQQYQGIRVDRQTPWCPLE